MRRTAVHFAHSCLLFFWLTLGLAAAQEHQSSTTPSSAPMAGATIADWRGNIRLNLPGQASSNPLRGEQLPPGTLLDTGSGRLLLRLSDGSEVLIRSHTRLLLQQPSIGDPSYFQLLLGRVRALIKKRTGGTSPFELGTPSAVIAVRGTQFDVEVNQRHVTEVDVVDGLVEVYGRDTSRRSVLVEPGFSTRVGIDTEPEQPRPTDEIRPEIERLGRDRGDREIGERGELEYELELKESEMRELQEIYERPEVEVENKKSESEPPH